LIDVQPADDGIAVASDTQAQPARNDAPLGRLPFNDPRTRDFFDAAWTIEDPGVKASWVVASPATITGQLPAARSIRMTMRLMNPHKDQSIVVKLNGREIGRWDEPEPAGWMDKSLVFTPTQDDLKKPANIQIEVKKVAPLSAADTRKLGIAAEIVTFEVVD
jgi:hypothetical protein